MVWIAGVQVVDTMVEGIPQHVRGRRYVYAVALVVKYREPHRAKAEDGYF